jgi:hypothetical protein
MKLRALILSCGHVWKWSMFLRLVAVILTSYIGLAILVEDCDAVRRILDGLAGSTPSTLRHMSRLADRLRGSAPDCFLN